MLELLGFQVFGEKLTFAKPSVKPPPTIIYIYAFIYVHKSMFKKFKKYRK